MHLLSFFKRADNTLVVKAGAKYFSKMRNAVMKSLHFK